MKKLWEVKNTETGGRYICFAKTAKAAQAKTNWPSDICEVKQIKGGPPGMAESDGQKT